MNRSPWLLSLLALAAACDEGGPLSCPLDFTGPVSSAYGDPRLDALFEATGAFSVATAETDAEMRDACNAIAMDLGAAMPATGGSRHRRQPPPASRLPTQSSKAPSRHRRLRCADP